MGRLLPAIATTLCLSASVGAQRQSAIRVEVDDERVVFDRAEPRMYGRRLLVPMRGVFEKIGAQVSYDHQKKLITAVRGDRNIRITIGDSVAFVNGEQRLLDARPRIYRGRILVPLRFLAENLNSGVIYIPELRLVRVRTHGENIAGL